MNGLLARVLDAHGGIDRWKGYEKVEATIVTGGGFFALKGLPQDLKSAAHDRVAARGALVCLPLRRSRSAHHVHAG